MMASKLLICSSSMAMNLSPPIQQQPQGAVGVHCSGKAMAAARKLQMMSYCSAATSTTATTTQNSINQTTKSVLERLSSANSYQPNIWNYESLQSLKTDHYKKYKHRAKKLKEEVHDMLRNEDLDSLSMLELIDNIQRLGLGYHFEKDINKALERFISMQEITKNKNNDLHATALSFRLLRQHGFIASQDVFKKFKDQNGNFDASLREDVKGMLSLYEASHIGLQGENLLAEAMAFTRMHLKDNKVKTSRGLAVQVCHALEVPLHHRMARQEARWYIEFEAQNNEMNTNPMLLELAKVDFNMVQSSLQTDLKDMSRWWKEMGLPSKLSFARDRLVESFFWAHAIVFEPQYSNCVKGLTKVATFVTTIDDVYDVNGTIDELETFTEAVKRWDVSVVEKLPNYMKLCYLALYNTVNEIAYDSLKQHGVNVIPYLSKAWGDLCHNFLQEAKWNYNKQTPTIDEYLENSWLSSSGALFLVHAYFPVSENITKEALQCLEQYHHLMRCASLLFRLYNDLSTSKAELERGETANSIVCYMHETGVSEEEAREKIRELIEKTWKNMNKYQITNDSSTPFSKKFKETAFNLARIAHFTYHQGDAHGAPDIKSKNRVESLIINPISLSLK